MESWWFPFLIGVLLGFILGGEYRHRLWGKQDRYWSEKTISAQKEHIALLKQRLDAVD